MLSQLTAVSPVDGRYHHQTRVLADIFSEYGLIRNRVLVEVRWFQFLASHPGVAELPALDKAASDYLEGIINDFDLADAEAIKAIEQKTNHDVKAVEYFIKDKLRNSGISTLAEKLEFVHFACTSEDINNLAHGLMLDAGRRDVLLPLMDKIISVARDLALAHSGTAMLSRTHGQVATPTTLGSSATSSCADAFRAMPGGSADKTLRSFSVR